MHWPNGSFLAKLLALAAAWPLAISCGGHTTDDGGLIPAPAYSWRGRLEVPQTGADLSGIRISVREEQEHATAGLAPHLGIQVLAENRFLIEYILHKYECVAGRDTTFVLHLDFVDPDARYEDATHTSSWDLRCTADSSAILPFPAEDSLRIELIPRP